MAKDGEYSRDGYEVFKFSFEDGSDEEEIGKAPILR